MSGDYVLKADLDLSTMAGDWVPLGYNAITGNTQFTGTFKADYNTETQQYYTIRNLYAQNTRSVAGLFAHIGSQATVENLRLENVYITAGDVTGTVAAINEGYISNLTVISSNENFYITSSNESGTSNVGGIVGINLNEGTIVNSYTKLNINVNSTTGRHGNGGGIAGINHGKINNSHSESTLIGVGQNSQYLGGITGSNVGKLERVYYNGNITASTTSNKIFVGGISGYLDVFGTIIYSSAQGGSYQGYGVGGLVGVSRGIVSESYVDVVNIKARYAGGLALNISEGSYTNTYTLAFMSGIDNNSIKAGFAYYIEYHSSSNYGKVQHSFSAASFDNIGTNYAETAAPVRTEYRGLVPRQAGYIISSIYDSLNQSLKEQNFISAFNTEFLIPEADRQIKVTTEHADGTDGNAFEKFITAGFNTSIWNFTVGNYPQLINAPVID
jgi:hypothetical protein